MGARSTFGALVVLAHLAIIVALLLLTAHTRTFPRAGAPVMTLIQLAPRREPAAVGQALSPKAEARENSATVTPAPSAIASLTAEAPAIVSPSAPLAITVPDWEQSLMAGAQTVVKEDQDKRRREAQLSRDQIDARALSKPDPVKAPHFSWSKKTDNNPGFVRVTERCGFALYLLLVMPVCQIGEIKVDGELFRDMNATPAMGGWSDDSRPNEKTMSERADEGPHEPEPED